MSSSTGSSESRSRKSLSVDVPPLHASLKKLLGTDDLADKALLLYRERFSDIGLFENQVYPGIPELLEALHCVAAADGHVSPAELAEIDRIAAELGIVATAVDATPELVE